MFLEDELDTSIRSILPIIQDRILNKSTYFGVKAIKSPLDAWIYQEIIYEVKPDVIIEIGNYFGGTTLFLAHLLDFIGKGKVIGLDLNHDKVPQSVKKHHRIKFIAGDACANFPHVLKQIKKPDRVIMVIEDSAHTFDNTLNILKTFSPLVTKGSYFIVEDSVCHHGLEVGPYPGPYEAVETFMKDNPNFIIDRDRESFIITYNPKGFLKRI